MWFAESTANHRNGHNLWPICCNRKLPSFLPMCPGHCQRAQNQLPQSHIWVAHKGRQTVPSYCPNCHHRQLPPSTSQRLNSLPAELLNLRPRLQLSHHCWNLSGRAETKTTARHPAVPTQPLETLANAPSYWMPCALPWLCRA